MPWDSLQAFPTNKTWSSWVNEGTTEAQCFVLLFRLFKIDFTFKRSFRFTTSELKVQTNHVSPSTSHTQLLVLRALLTEHLLGLRKAHCRKFIAQSLQFLSGIYHDRPGSLSLSLRQTLPNHASLPLTTGDHPPWFYHLHVLLPWSEVVYTESYTTQPFQIAISYLGCI